MGYEDVAPAAIRKGMFLTVDMLKFLHKTIHFRIPNPKKKEGSGKGGRLKKEDFAWYAVLHYFETESEEEKLRMFNGIMNTAASVVPCPAELLEAIDHLDPIYREDFDELKQVCKEQRKRQQSVSVPPLSQPAETVSSVPMEEVELKLPEGVSVEEKEPRTIEPHSKSEAKLYTPATLNSLIPGRGMLRHVYIKRLPGTRKTYQGFYPGPCSNLCVVFLLCNREFELTMFTSPKLCVHKNQKSLVTYIDKSNQDHSEKLRPFKVSAPQDLQEKNKV